MKINDIYESTTSGSVATVAQPMTTQARNASIYGGKKGGNLLTGKKTSKKYANSLAEAAGEFKGEHVTVLYIDDKPAVKYTDITKAKKEMEILKRKLPSSKKLELKQEVREAGMPQSVLRNKQKLAKMTDAELADHLKGKSDDELKRLAWRHGYGNMSSHYVNRIKKVTESTDTTKYKVQIICDDGGETSYTVSAKTKEEALRKATKFANDDEYEDFYAKIITEPNKKSVQESVDSAYKLGRNHGLKGINDNKFVNVRGMEKKNKAYEDGRKEGMALRQTHKKVTETNKKPVQEGRMKEIAMDIRDMDNGNFQKKYKKSKEQLKRVLGDPDKKPVQEAQLEEDDLILVPGQGHRLKSGFIPHGESRLDHEVEMAKSDLFSAAKNAKQVYEMIAGVSEEEGLEGWVQEKIIKANDYLNTIREYLEGKQAQAISGGGIGEGIVDKLKGAVRREKAKDLPLLQTRRDYATMKAGDEYAKGETRKGSQYMAWAERDREKKGDPSTNPMGTYRTKTSDYSSKTIDEGAEDWRTDQMKWHGGSDISWYEHQKQNPIKVKLVNPSKMGGQPKGLYTVKSFNKISPTEAEIVVSHRGQELTGKVDLDNPATHLDKNYDKKRDMEFYSGQRPIAARQAFNLFQTQLHNSVKEGRVLGIGMSPEARARDIDQSDIEYIEQREFKDQWKQENPGKKWPGYDKAGFKSRYDSKWD